jgi:hypothetical protein
MAEVTAAKDAQVCQGIGRTAQYGNGDGGIIHCGRLPSGTTDPDWKFRGMFEWELRNGSTGILDGVTSISAAEVEFTVAPNTCIVDGRGNVFYAFFEEMTADFTEKAVGSDCAVGLGTGSGVWGASNAATTTNRAFISESGLGTGDKVTKSVLAMLQAALADTSKTVLRGRLIYANSAGTAYDETAGAARGTGFYSSENGTPGNRPVLRVTTSAGTVAKISSDDFQWQELGGSVSSGSTGGGTQNLIGEDSFEFADSIVYVGPSATWRVEDGTAVVNIPAADMETHSLLDGVSSEDVEMWVRFAISKTPTQAAAVVRLLARANGVQDFYSVAAKYRRQGVVLQIERRLAGETETLVSIVDIRAAMSRTEYWLKMRVEGDNPTTISAKVWFDHEQGEPEAWQLLTTDSSAGLQDAGAVGLGASTNLIGNPPIEFLLDEFNVAEA